MPNYVHNLIKVVDGDFQAINNFMKSEKYDFDFNHLIPMPQSMVELMTKYNGMSKQSELGFEYWSNPSQRCKKVKYSIIDKIKEQGYDLHETLREGLDRLCVYADCGYWNSLEWAVAKWGTKWNAFDVVALPSDRTIFFNTAWSAPIPIYKALARQFPTHKISVKYYDEGGWFAGYCNIKDGDEFGEDYDCESAEGQRIINEVSPFIHGDGDGSNRQPDSQLRFCCQSEHGAGDERPCVADAGQHHHYRGIDGGDDTKQWTLKLTR